MKIVKTPYQITANGDTMKKIDSVDIIVPCLRNLGIKIPLNELKSVLK